MSAREDDFEGLGPAGEALLSIGGQDMPVGYGEVREAMDAYRAEVLREAAAKIRHHIGGDSYAADLIDPDTP